MTTNYILAANVIAHFEGFISHAAWDVNAWRVGFGSDTEGPEQVPVRRGTSTTWQRALLNLQARIPQYEKVILLQLNDDTKWNFVPDNAKAALLSFAYNYGSLTEHVLAALRSGNLSSVSRAVEDRGEDNRGVNAKRRFAEATLIASVE